MHGTFKDVSIRIIRAQLGCEAKGDCGRKGTAERDKPRSGLSQNRAASSPMMETLSGRRAVRTVIGFDHARMIVDVAAALAGCRC